jgi:hypothetical protein
MLRMIRAGWVVSLVYFLPTFVSLRDNTASTASMGNCVYLLLGAVFAQLFAIPFAFLAARREALLASYQMHREGARALDEDAASSVDEFRRPSSVAEVDWRTERSWDEVKSR